MRETNDLNVIKNIKILMMLLVVLSHSCAIFTGTQWGGIHAVNNSFWLGQLSKFLGTFHTQTFVAVSGYLFYMNRYEHGKYRKGIVDIKNRAKRLLIPYFCASVLWVIPAYCLINGFNASALFQDFVLGESPAQLWFLVMLFGVYVVFYFCSDFLFSIGVFSAIATCLFICFASVVYSKLGGANLFQIIKLMQNIIFFYIGGLIRKYGLKRLEKYCILVVFQIILYSVSIYVQTLDSTINFLHYFLEPFVSICGILSTFAICSFIVFKGNILYSLGRCGMGIYLLHQQIIYILARIMNISEINPLIQTSVVFVGALLISWAISNVANKTKLGRLILGM